MKISRFLHHLVSPFERICHFSSRNSTAIQPMDDDSIWAEDDEELNQYMRYAKEFFQRHNKEHQDGLDKDDSFTYWQQGFDSTVYRLNEELRTPFKLYMQGCEHKKIAELLQLDIETVKSSIKDAQIEVRRMQAEMTRSQLVFLQK